MKDMKFLIFVIVFLIFATGAVKFSLKTLRFAFDYANAVNCLGIVLIMLGLVLFGGYNRYLGSKQSGYWEGYKDGVDDSIEVLRGKEDATKQSN